MNTNQKYTMPAIVVARSDGRGGIIPYGTFSKNQAGAKVQIGEKQYTVTRDGRINIPKAVMNRGIKGSDGRMRIGIGFASEKGIDGWKELKSVIVKPDANDKNAKHGERISKFDLQRNKKEKTKDLVPRDTPDYTWSN